jgi:hypothetical protein
VLASQGIGMIGLANEHESVTKEGDAAKHLLFTYGPVAGKSITDALSKLFTVCHGSTPKTNGLPLSRRAIQRPAAAA